MIDTVKITHPQYGYVEFSNLSIRQKDVLKSLVIRKKKLKFVPTKKTTNG